MNRIIFPLEAGRQGPEVADLQAALQLLLDRGVKLGFEVPEDEVEEVILTGARKKP